MRTLRTYVLRYCKLHGLILSAGLLLVPSGFGAETSLVSTGAVWRYFAAGSEPDTGWQSPQFDDSTWSLGPAELGFGDGDETTVIPRVNSAYFRGTFNVVDPANVTSLFADVWRDDGVIVYINGIEVMRDNMPAFTPNYFTLALGPALDDGEDPIRGNITPTVLVAGLNTIAVEVHQSSFSSTDLSFDLMLVADAVDPNRPPTANSRAAVAVQNTPTQIVLSGTDPDGNALTYTIISSPSHGTLSGTPPNVIYTSASDYVGPDSFTFRVNDGALDSADAVVSIQVLAPPDPPEVIAAIGECSATEVVVMFDEAVDVMTATEARNYTIADSSGNVAPVLAAVLAADQQTVSLRLGSPLNPASSYMLQVASVCDLIGDCLLQQTVPIQVESQPLILTCNVARPSLWPPNSSLVDVGLNAVSSGTITGVQVFSNEPDTGNGDAQFANGGLAIRAQREGKLHGRVYLIVVTSTDACGNEERCCTTVVAPHDSSQAALAAVNAEAAAARAQCSPSGSSLTPYPILQ